MTIQIDTTPPPAGPGSPRRAAGDWRYAASLIAVALIVGGALLVAGQDHAEPGKTVAAASMTPPAVLDH